MSLLNDFLPKCTDSFSQQVDSVSPPLPVTCMRGQQGMAVTEIALEST